MLFSTAGGAALARAMIFPQSSLRTQLVEAAHVLG